MKDAKVDRRVQATIATIEIKLADKLQVEELAQRANISSSHLRHVFKFETGLSLTKYVKLTRLKRAEHLLRTTFLSVKEVMNKVGINNESYFSREFRKTHGLAPSKYRCAIESSLESSTDTSEQSNDAATALSPKARRESRLFVKRL
jgi:transcriptional regulator GlxA family with amidase domain